MRKTVFWGSPWSLLLLLLVLPPLGLVMLWMSRRTLFLKVVVSALALVYMGVLGSAVYGRIVEPAPPERGFDVSRNALGYYRNPRIYNLEAQVFDAVVRLQREAQLRGGRAIDEEPAEPNAEVFDTVAARFGLGSGDVRDIYLKVSVLEAHDLKRK